MIFLTNMSLGEIRMFAGSFAPAGWSFCDGSALPISENEVLFQLIGTTYGGDGQTYFNVPDYQGRAPMHYSPGDSVPGEKAGVETVTLTVNQMPAHTHALNGHAGFASQTSPANGVFAVPFLTTNFCPAPIGMVLGTSETISPSGGSQPHDNMQPSLVRFKPI
jgi:microcystin-dependent protein